MAARAKTGQNPLLRKLGPLPVVAWLGLAVLAWLLFFRGQGAAAQTNATAVPNAASNGAQQPSSGMGTPADNGNSDLLSELLSGQRSSYDALLAALQSTTAGGATGSAGPTGYSSAPASDAAASFNGAPAASVQLAGPAASSTTNTASPTLAAQPAVLTQDYSIPAASPLVANANAGPTNYAAVAGQPGGGGTGSDVVSYGVIASPTYAQPAGTYSQPTPSLDVARAATGKGAVVT